MKDMVYKSIYLNFPVTIYKVYYEKMCASTSYQIRMCTLLLCTSCTSFVLRLVSSGRIIRLIAKLSQRHSVNFKGNFVNETAVVRSKHIVISKHRTRLSSKKRFKANDMSLFACCIRQVSFVIPARKLTRSIEYT